MECASCDGKVDVSNSAQTLGCSHSLCRKCFSRSLSGNSVKCPKCDRRYTMSFVEEALDAPEPLCRSHGEPLESFCRSCNSPACETCWSKVHSTENSCRKAELQDGLREEIDSQLPLLSSLIDIFTQRVDLCANTLSTVAKFKPPFQNAVWCIEQDESDLNGKLNDLTSELDKLSHLKNSASSANSSEILLDVFNKLKLLRNYNLQFEQERKLTLHQQAVGIFKLYPICVMAMKKLLEREQPIYVMTTDDNQQECYGKLGLEEDQIWLHKFEQKLPINSICFESSILIDYQLTHNLNAILDVEDRKIVHCKLRLRDNSLDDNSKVEFLKYCLGLSNSRPMRILSGRNGLLTLTNNQNPFVKSSSGAPTFDFCSSLTTERDEKLQFDIPAVKLDSEVKFEIPLFPKPFYPLSNQGNAGSTSPSKLPPSLNPTTSKHILVAKSTTNSDSNVFQFGDKGDATSVQFGSEAVTTSCNKYTDSGLPVIVDQMGYFCLPSQRPTWVGKDLKVIGYYDAEWLALPETIKWDFRLAFSF